MLQFKENGVKFEFLECNMVHEFLLLPLKNSWRLFLQDFKDLDLRKKFFQKIFKGNFEDLLLEAEGMTGWWLKTQPRYLLLSWKIFLQRSSFFACKTASLSAFSSSLRRFPLYPYVMQDLSLNCRVNILARNFLSFDVSICWYFNVKKLQILPSMTWGTTFEAEFTNSVLSIAAINPTYRPSKKQSFICLPFVTYWKSLNIHVTMK